MLHDNGSPTKPLGLAMALCFNDLSVRRTNVRTVFLLALTIACGLPVDGSAQPRPDGPLDAVTAATPEVLARNKRNVVEFYELAFNRSKPREAIEKYAGDTYKEHSPEVPDGKDGFVWHYEKLARDYPGKRLAIKRALAEGNHVIVHRWSKLPALLGDTEFMAIDIFRLDDSGRIVEHWDVEQRIPRSSTNRNSIF